jgi:FKBP-type peptidyl-prolyl cis-trans isomerase
MRTLVHPRPRSGYGARGAAACYRPNDTLIFKDELLGVKG